MKITFYSSFAKLFAACMKNLFFVLLSVLIFSSCKKEILTDEKENLAITQNGSVKVTNINYAGFLEKVNPNSLGTLKTAFQSQQPTNGKLMSFGGTSALGGLNFLTDSIRQISTAKGNSFVFRMPQTSVSSRVFQNLTISMLQDTTIAFITTYSPSNEWVNNRKNKIFTTYKGQVVYTPINLKQELAQQSQLSNNGLATSNNKLANVSSSKTMTTVTVCNTFIMYTEIFYGCSDGGHMPWDTDCIWNTGTPVPSGEYAGGSYYSGTPITACNSIAVEIGGTPGGGGPGGGTGGGGDTSPYPPEGYNPCEPGIQCGEEYDGTGGGNAVAQAFANQIGLTNFNHIAFLGHPDNVQILGTLKNYFTTYGNSADNKEFLKWSTEYLYENQLTIDFNDFKRDFLTGDAGLDVSDLGTDGSGQNMNFDIYFDNVDGDFKFISKNDPNYSNVINNGTTALPTQFSPATTQLLRQMGKDKGWDVGVSTLEFNRRVGQAFQEATYKLYRSKLNPLQLPKVKYQPQNIISTWRKDFVQNTGKVVPDWTFDVSYGLTSLALPQHMFYDAKAVNGPLYLSSSKYQIGGYLDVLSRKRANNAPPPALVFVTPVNTIISPSILATAIAKGVQIRQAFVIIINNKLYLLNSIEITPANDRFYNIPLNVLKIIAGPVDLEYPVNPNNGPDYEELQQ